MVEIIEAENSLNDFIKFPLSLFKKDPCFVPQLTREMKVHFSQKNPFFEHASVKFFLARKDGKVAGRIAAFVNGAHNALHREKTGFFGFFESIDDSAVSDALFAKAASYLQNAGMERMRGPMSFSTNEECGFLLEGFDSPPMIMMPYNLPYYNDLSEKYGMIKVKDLYAYIYRMKEHLPEKVLRVAAIVEKRGLTVRPMNMNRFMEDMMIFKDIYHSAWSRNWGFVPMSDKELEYAAGRLKQIIVPDLIQIAEEDGNPVGFFGLVPDFNFVLKRMNGSLNPVSIARALYYSKKVRDLRAMLLGVKKEYRNRGVEALMFRDGFKAIKQGGYQRVEFSWILEDNIPVQRTTELFGGRLYKQYRIYEIPL